MTQATKVGVRFIDLTVHAEGEQTEFDGDLVFSGEPEACEGCGVETDHYWEDAEMGLTQCLRCLDDMIVKGLMEVAS